MSSATILLSAVSVTNFFFCLFVFFSEVKACCGDEGQIEPFSLNCKVTFTSPKPVSFAEQILFSFEEGDNFPLLVTATADNCLMSCYPFLALHRTDHQIVCEQVLITVW